MQGKIIKHRIIFISAIAGICICIAACISILHTNYMSLHTTTIPEEVTPLAQNVYDSEDNIIVISKNTQDKLIQFQNIRTGKRYTLSYNGSISLLDKNQQPLAITQIEPGMIATIRFYKETKKLVSLFANTECLHLEDVTHLKINHEKNTITYRNQTYKLNQHLTILSDEKEVSLMDINEVDVLSLWGFSDQIYSIQIKKGHGYLRLQNETYFIDGWIEVGQSIIRKITEDMLLVVPEGNETVSISHNGSSASQTIHFNRNEEIVWDLGTVEIVLPKTGSLIFTLTPDTAKVVIDGNLVDITNPVSLTYGVHQIVVSADGYDSISKYIKVNAPSTNIAMNLEKKEQEEENEKEESKTDTSASSAIDQTTTAEESEIKPLDSQTTQTDQTDNLSDFSTSSTTYKVHIDSPEGVEVYLDGNYIGIAPIDFKKEAGDYIITLRKDGYQTRSYSLQVDNEDKDVTYSFSALLAK